MDQVLHTVVTKKTMTVGQAPKQLVKRCSLPLGTPIIYAGLQVLMQDFCWTLRGIPVHGRYFNLDPSGADFERSDTQGADHAGSGSSSAASGQPVASWVCCLRIPLVSLAWVALCLTASRLP